MSQNQMKSTKSMVKGTEKVFLGGRRENRHRLAFTRFLIREYGLNIQTVYGKLRRSLVKEWELEGIANCIVAFQPDYEGNIYVFWEQCRKTDFCRFMETKGISENTVRKRFTLQNFSELEVIGLNAAYERFKEESGTENAVDENGENNEEKAESKE